MERVFYHKEGGAFARPNVPSGKVVTKVLSAFTVAFQGLISLTVPEDIRVYPENHYRGRKLRLNQRARDNIIGRTVRGRNFAALKSFIKHEKILIKNKRLVPRVIQPRSPEYNVCVGRYIRQLEHRIYGIIDKLWSGATVMKGRNSAQQGAAIAQAWQTFSHPVGVMLDAVRFDQHVSVPMLAWEHSIYLSFFPKIYQPELEWLLSMQLFNRGTIRCPDGQLRYEVQGCRASGDMNTAMGNVLIMCATMHAFVNQLGIRARLINNGDDCCLIVEREHVERVRSRITDFYRELGFIIDVEGYAHSLEEVSFCQTKPVFNGAGWQMVRNPHVAISKDVTIIKKWSPKEYGVYLQQLGVAGLALYGNMPVWRSFYKCLSRAKVVGTVTQGLIDHVSTSIWNSGLGRLAVGMENQLLPITDAARASFGTAFGITPEAQRSLEEYYDNMDPGTRELYPGPAGSRLF